MLLNTFLKYPDEQKPHRSDISSMLRSVVVELKAEDTTLVFCGDECYTSENIKRMIPTGSSENKEKSLYFIQKYSAPGYTVHTCHDFGLKSEKIL